MAYARIVFSMLVCSIIIFSCGNSKNDLLINSLNNSLIQSTQVIKSNTEKEYQELSAKVTDPIKINRSKSWYSKANNAREYSNKIVAEIDSLKTNLKNSFSSGSQEEFYKIITEYKALIESLDNEVIPLLQKEQSFRLITDDKISEDYLKSLSREELSALFTNYINSIAIIEYKLVSYFNSNSQPGCNLQFEKFSSLVTQNTNHLKAGEYLEIYAGIGALTIAAQPTIEINDQIIKANDDYLFRYKLKTSGFPGEKSVPVRIRYMNQNGEQLVETYDVSYFIDP